MIIIYIFNGLDIKQRPDCCDYCSNLPLLQKVRRIEGLVWSVDCDTEFVLLRQLEGDLACSWFVKDYLLWSKFLHLDCYSFDT